MLEDSLEFAGLGPPGLVSNQQKDDKKLYYKIDRLPDLTDVNSSSHDHLRSPTQRVLAGRAAASAPPGALRAAPGPGQSWSREAERSSGMGMWVRRAAGFGFALVHGWCDHEVQAKSSLHINNRQSNVGSGSQLGRTGVNGDARWGRGIHDMRRQFHVISAYIHVRALGERLDLVRQSIPDLTHSSLIIHSLHVFGLSC